MSDERLKEIRGRFNARNNCGADHEAARAHASGDIRDLIAEVDRLRELGTDDNRQRCSVCGGPIHDPPRECRRCGASVCERCDRQRGDI